MYVLIPIFGIILFCVFYFIAALYYPGGSQIDTNAVGFSWRDNYWCNLLDQTAINGHPNQARRPALAGMIFLCLSLVYFWFLFARFINTKVLLAGFIRVTGCLTVLFSLLLFTRLPHDWVTNLVSLSGIMVSLGTIAGVYRLKWNFHFRFGLFNLFLVVINNYFYYHKELIIYLPVVQKVSFVSFLLWICSIAYRLYKSIRSLDKNR